MTFRVSTSLVFKQGIDNILFAQSRMFKTQNELATGKRIVTPSDDPAGQVQAMAIQEALDTQTQYASNSNLAQGRLEVTESTLNSVTDSIQRIRELLIQANNDSNTNEDRVIIAQEVREQLQHVLDLANTTDANDEYIFAGTRTQSEPFARANPGFVYNGDDQQRFVQISDSQQIPVNDPGSDVFMDILNGNATYFVADLAANTGSGIIDPGSVLDLSQWIPDTYTLTFLTPTTYEIRDSAAALVTAGNYTDGEAINFLGIEISVSGIPDMADEFTIASSVNQNLFQTYQNIIDTLESTSTTPPNANTDLHNSLNRELQNLDQALDTIIRTQTSVGARRRTLDVQSAINDDFLVNYRTTLSEIQDLDYAEAIGRFQLQSVTLEAAQQTFVDISRLSLFNFL